MPRTDSIPSTSRRSLLASLPAVALGVTAAVPALAAEVSPDAELIAACAAFTAIYEQRDQVWDTPTSSDAEEERLDKEADLLGDRIYELSDEITDLRAATDAGKAAKARVASLLADRNPDGTIVSEDLTASVLWSLVADHTGEPHVVASPYVTPSAPRPSPDAELIALCDQYLASKPGHHSEWYELMTDLTVGSAEKEKVQQIMQERREVAKATLAQIAATPAHTRAGEVAKVRVLKREQGVLHPDGRYRMWQGASSTERVAWSLFADLTGERA